MKIFSLAIMVLALTIGQAHAQDCRTLRYDASEIHVESLELFDTGGKFSGRILKKALPAQFDVSDCNDPVYVMLHLETQDFLVRKVDLATPAMKNGCLKVPKGQMLGVQLGVPGAADITTCP